MARKASAGTEAAHGFNDIIGIVLTGFSLLLLVALLSYNPHDVSANKLPPNPSTHNWIGPIGAWTAWFWFFLIGAAAYEMPALLFFLGLGCFFQFFAYLRRRWPWTLVLLVCCFGLLDLYKGSLESLHQNLRTPPGGILGVNMNRFIFGYFGTVGATIIFVMLCTISVLMLTNFQLGEWMRDAWADRKAERNGDAEEQALERRARELRKQAKQLEEEVERTGPKERAAERPAANERKGLGPDLKPVPEPTVRDLSIPQSKSARSKKPTEVAPPDEGEVIPAHEVAAATTADILGKKSDVADKKDGDGKDEEDSASSRRRLPDEKAELTEKTGTEEKLAEAKPEDVNVIGLPSAAPKPKPTPKKPRPITVASTPMIGNYQLPSHDFLQHPDPNIKPTESKEELMTNAQLMQQTLAQFDIEVSLGDITKGPK